MREIKFRGYDIDNKCWRYFEIDGVGADIFYYNINESSIGQYTGFTDKNGKKIYEGDILDCGFGVVKRVCFVDGRWLSMCSEDKKYDSDLLQDVLSSMCEVIGNTYEEELKEDK